MASQLSRSKKVTSFEKFLREIYRMFKRSRNNEGIGKNSK